MSDDLIARLRDAYIFLHDPLLKEAADEIDRLREALEFYACECRPGQCENGPLESNRDTVSCGYRARAALTDKQGE